MEKTTIKTRHLLEVLIVSIMLALYPSTSLMADDCSPPGATASVSGVITCGNPTVTLLGTSPGRDVEYHWDGPDDFESGLQNQGVSIPGQYILTVTDSTGNCESKDTVVVLRDIEQPDAIATVTDTLNCGNTDVILHGSTNIDIVDADFYWIGPGDFISHDQNTVTSIKGGYTLIVTDLSNECASTATLSVEEDLQAPLASAYVSGQLTCLNNSVELTSSSPTGGVTYTWIGPSGYVSYSQDTTASIPGDYTVIVADPTNYCSSSSTVEVVENKEEPGAYITSTADEITCSTENATLTASSNYQSVNYRWDGPGGFSSTVVNPIVATPGDYILTVTRSGNGCVSKDTFNLGVNKVKPGASAASSGPLTCVINTVTLLGTSPTNDVDFKWMGNGINSTEQNTPTTKKGTYMLFVTNPRNGCASYSFTSVQEKRTLPASVTAENEGPITCTNDSVALLGNSTTPGVTYHWTGPNLDTQDQNPIVEATGTYLLTVTDPTNECFVERSTDVTDDLVLPADVTAGNTGDLTCLVKNVNLKASSSTPGAEYSWTGPGGFNSGQQNPGTNTSGKYYLTVEDPDNGCTVLDSTEVVLDILAPEDIFASNDGDLDCYKTMSNLSTGSSTSDVIYSWEGPGGYYSDAQNPSVGIMGKYTVTITNPVNGCFDTVSTYLAQDTIHPKDVLATNDGAITCGKKKAMLLGSSSTPGVDYIWNLPDSISHEQNTEVSESGTFSLTVTDPDNSCSVTATTTVYADTLIPIAVHAENNGSLTCLAGEIMLTGSSLTERISYYWTGPGGFVSTVQSPMVSDSGKYFLTITDTVNGCSDKATTRVLQDEDPPDNVMAFNDGSLYCSDTVVMLTAMSTTGGVSFSWTGPGGYSADTDTAETSAKGEYIVTVTDTANGCSATATTYVDQDTAQPLGVMAYNDGPLTCVVHETTLTGSSTTPGVLYRWEGPGNYVDSVASPTTSETGTYTVTITHPVSGCYDTASTLVTENVSQPGALATIEGIFTCDNTTIDLNAESTTPTVEYSWTGTKGFTSSEQSPEISVHDTYTLTVTDTVNGCESTDAVTTQLDTVSPGVTAAVYDEITCEIISVTLQAYSPEQDAKYSWTGPESYHSTEQYPVTTEGGWYYVQARNPANGCTSIDSVEVAIDTVIPRNIQALVSDTINCYSGTVTLSGSSTTPDVEYRWDCPDNSTQFNQSIDVDEPGKYRLTVTNPLNKCYDSTHVEVFENIQEPQDVAISASSHINCDSSEVTLTGNTSTTNVTYKWSGPGLNSPKEQSIRVSQRGWFTLIVTDTVNGCSQSDAHEVLRDLTPPAGISTSVSGELTCADTAVQISATSSTPDVEYSWTGPGGFVAAIQSPMVSVGGGYTVIVTNPNNGCSVSRNVHVDQDTVAPAEVTASASGELTCEFTSISLSAYSTTLRVKYLWTSPGGYSSTLQNPIITEADDYTVVVTDTVNGCSQTRIVEVPIDTTPPADVVATVSDDINCYNDGTVMLSGNSSTPNAGYKWNGGPFVDYEDQTIPTMWGGVYILTVTDPINKCSADDTITVMVDTASPEVTTTDESIRCDNPSALLTASSETPGVTYTWTGPGIVDAGLQNQSVSLGGIYLVTVFNPVNGCDTKSEIDVFVDTVSPGLTAFADDDILTCGNPDVELTASTNIPNSDVAWIGHPGENPLIVTVPDEYTAIATDLNNGCSTQRTVVVTQDTSKPDLLVTASGTLLTCDIQTVTLTAETTTSNTILRWAEFGEDENPIVVSEGGSYSVSAQDTTNGCITTSVIVVEQDISVPEGLSALNTGLITCDSTSIHLLGSTITEDVSYEWIHSDSGLVATTQNAVIDFPGEYTLVVEKNSTGCTSQEATNVGMDKSAPEGVTASNTGTITCDSTSIHLLGATTTTEGVGFEWSHSVLGIVATTKDAEIDLPGEYTFVVEKNSTGCTTSASTSVGIDKSAPEGVTASNTGPITCDSASIHLLGSTTTVGVGYEWIHSDSGLVATTQNAVVDFPGEFALVVEKNSTGCTSTATTEVDIDLTVPEGVAASNTGTITCDSTSIHLLGSTTTVGVGYEWIHSDSGLVATTQNAEIDLPGDYTLVVEKNSTGCTSQAVTNVGIDVSAPEDVTASNTGTITCDSTSIHLLGSTTTGDVGFEWSHSTLGLVATTQNAEIDLPGDYTLVVEKNSTGCTNTATTNVLIDQSAPEGVSASNTGPITCDSASIHLLGSTTTVGVGYEWIHSDSGLVAVTQNAEIDLPGEYTLVVEKNSNGCTSTATTEVDIDLTVPEGVAASNTGTITCDSTSIHLLGSTTTVGVGYEWIHSDSGLVATTKNAVIDFPGEYTLVVEKNSTGCTSTAITDVDIDLSVPEDVTASNTGTITCDSTSIHLLGSTTTGDVGFEWSHSTLGLVATTQNAEIDLPGDYTLVVEKNSTGCTSTATTNVVIDQSAPEGVSASNTGLITCDSTSIHLLGNTTTGDVGYEWSHSLLGLVATTQNAEIDLPGEYTLVVEKNSTGCTISATTTVGIDQSGPSCNIIPPSSSPVQSENDTLRAEVQNGVSYSWSIDGVGWSIVSGQNSAELIYNAGATGSSATFTLDVKKDDNGCNSFCTIELTAVATKNAEGFTRLNNEGGIQIDAYPNPFDEYTWIEFTSAVRDFVTIAVYNINGQLVKTVFDSEVEAHVQYNVSINGTNMEQGTYYCLIKTKEKVYTRKLLLVR